MEEESGLANQFGIENGYGALIYKPKRSKYLLMSQEKILENQQKMSLINPSTVKNFLDEALSGGGTWQKLEPKDAELALKDSTSTKEEL